MKVKTALLPAPKRQSRVYVIMLLLCFLYAGMSLLVLVMHVYTYDQFIKFNSEVALQFSNQSNSSQFNTNELSAGVGSGAGGIDARIEYGDRIMPRDPRLNLNNESNGSFDSFHSSSNFRHIGPEFFLASKLRAAWIFGVLIAVSVIGVILPIVAGMMLHNLSSAQSIIRAQESALTYLTTAEEKQIITLLRTHNGALTQSELVSETGLTKVKVHRVLSRLESLGLIEKHPYGMTNKIVLVQTLQEEH